MSLKLFRSTGYSSMFEAGETRVSTHPGWALLLAMVWPALTCNVAMWRVMPHLAVPAQWPQVAFALGWSVVIAATTGLVMATLAWRNTLKLVATLVLLGWAFAAGYVWTTGLPLDATLPARGWRALGATGVGWLDYRLWLAVAVLGLVPVVWLARTTVKGLPLMSQLRINIVLLGASLVALVLCLPWLFPALSGSWLAR